jgi:carnosine N-methyltransferase
VWHSAYALHFHRVVTNSQRKAFFALPSKHQELLIGPPFKFLERFQEIEDAIDTNSNCAIDILETGLKWAGLAQLMEFIKVESPSDQAPQLQPMHFDTETGQPCVPGLQPAPEHLDFGKASSTIRHLYREWSAEGAPEREACFKPLTDFLLKFYKDIPQRERHKIKILNPGCGLGRFVFDLACLGFEAEGCEISYHMLIGSMHMMNFIERAGQYRIHPFVLQGSNHLMHENRMRQVMVPDIYPRDTLNEASLHSEIHGSDRLGISTGDFSVVYKQEEFRNRYDVIATIFFLDTAKNPISYIETVVNCLKPGGIWMNLGPLKWHFEYWDHPRQDDDSDLKSKRPEGGEGEDQGIANPGAVLLAEKDILELLNRYGFELLHYKGITSHPTGYIHDHRSMETNMFYPSFWVAIKSSTETQNESEKHDIDLRDVDNHSK